MVTATAPIAESRTLLPSAPATRLRSMEVVMTLVASLATALFGQLDPIAFDLSTVPT